MSLRTNFAARAARQSRADRPARSIGSGSQTTLERNRAAALMRLAQGAAMAASSRVRPRPDWASIEDAASEVTFAALKAHGGDPVAALAAVGVADTPAAIAAAIGGRVAPDLAMVAGARRFLDSRAADRNAADYAELNEAATIEERAEASAAIRERRVRLQLEDGAADPLPAETLAAVEAGFPGPRNKSIRVAIVAALAGGVAPDIRHWAGVETDAAVRMAVKRGTAALARVLTPAARRMKAGQPLRAGESLMLAALHRIFAADGSAGRFTARDDASRAALVALMDSTVSSGQRGSRTGVRAPRAAGSPAAALQRARDAEPSEPLHFRYAHNRDARRRPPQRRPFIGPLPQPIPTTVAQQAARAAHTRRSSLKIKEAICAA